LAATAEGRKLMAYPPTDGPVFIRSADNPALTLTVTTNPAGDGAATTLEKVEADEWNAPLSQWVLEPIAAGVYRIALFASQSMLYLNAGGTTAGSAIVVSAGSPDPSQLWEMTVAEEGCWLASKGAAGFEAGFSGDIPIPGIPIVLEQAHDSHSLGDRFVIASVAFAAPTGGGSK
jgi:hypothetical protein